MKEWNDWRDACLNKWLREKVFSEHKSDYVLPLLKTPRDFLKILTVPHGFYYWAPPSSQPHHKPLCPMYVVFQTLWPFSRPLTMPYSLNSCHLHKLFFLLGQLFISLHITSLGKSSWGGPLSYTISVLTTQLLRNVCELQESGTGLPCSQIFLLGPAHECWMNDWTL